MRGREGERAHGQAEKGKLREEGRGVMTRWDGMEWSAEPDVLCAATTTTGHQRILQYSADRIWSTVILCAATGLPKGCGKKLSSSQEQLG